MTTKADKQAQEIAALKREVAELKAKVDPPKSTFKPMSDAEWRDQMHQLAEKRASVIPPWLREACAGGVSDRDARAIAATARAPTGRPGMIPDSQISVRPPANVPGSGTGWAREIPLGPPPGLRYVDQQIDAQDAKDRADRTQQHAQMEAMRRFAEQTEIINKKIEAIGSKLAGQKK
jgi:hypothetical protein